MPSRRMTGTGVGADSFFSGCEGREWSPVMGIKTAVKEEIYTLQPPSIKALWGSL
jgi:hypothetical protein